MSPIGNWQHFVLVWVTARRTEFSVAAFTLLITRQFVINGKRPWGASHGRSMGFRSYRRASSGDSSERIEASAELWPRQSTALFFPFSVA